MYILYILYRNFVLFLKNVSSDLTLIYFQNIYFTPRPVFIRAEEKIFENQRQSVYRRH